jgi:hypothetical protein
MSRLEAIEEVERWYTSLSTIIEEEEEGDLYVAYWEKLEAIDNQCEGYTDFEDVPDLRF